MLECSSLDITEIRELELGLDPEAKQNIEIFVRDRMNMVMVRT